MTIPVLLHIPHSSTLIPEEYLSSYKIGVAALAYENLRLADMHTDILYDLPGAERAVFPVSRFLVDAERFSDDAQESMAARGMGVLYSHTTDLKLMRDMPHAAARAELLNRYYHPHHNAINDWADRALASHGKGLLIDCHSFPSNALPYELGNMELERPEICIGTDSFHTPAGLREELRKYFEGKGYWTGIDEPFSGSLTPGKYYGQNKNIHSFMIEVRKDLYMNEKTGEMSQDFNIIRDDVSGAMEMARDYFG